MSVVVEARIGEENETVREDLLRAVSVVLSEHGVDSDAVRIKELSLDSYGKITVELRRR